MSEENNKMILNFILLLGVLTVSEAGLEPKVEIYEISGNTNGNEIKFRPLNLNHKNSQLAKYLLQSSIQPKAKTQPLLDIDIDLSQMAKLMLQNSNEIKERAQSPLESDSYTPHAKFLYQKGNQLKERPQPPLDLSSASLQISKMLLEGDALKEKLQLLDSDSSSQLLKLLFENNNQPKDKSLTLDLSDSSSYELGDGRIILVDADALLGKISNLNKPKRNLEDELLANLESKILDFSPEIVHHRSPSFKRGIYPKESYIPDKTVLRSYFRDRSNNNADSTSRPVHYHRYEKYN